MTINPSPLRYPGGKNRLSEYIAVAIENAHINNCTYIEPFAGGAGVALSLLINGNVENIVINDFDKAIYSFWRAVKQDNRELINRIKNTPITIDEWRRQKRIYSNSNKYSVDLAFATLYLNRTNRSGILSAGPIGGYAQDGEWKIDARFDREALIQKIATIAKFRNNITVYNKDIISLIKNYIPNYGNNTFIYFDPPYYNKGQKLYKNFLTHNDHKKIHDIIEQEIHTPWIITYDDVKEINMLYSKFNSAHFNLTYSAANKGTASELMLFSNKSLQLTSKQLCDHHITVDFYI